MFNVVLVHPEIPPNTGNVIRLCANTGCTLHLVKPLGCALRAGLDYPESAPIRIHESWEAFLESEHPDVSCMYAMTTHGSHPFADSSFTPGDWFVFGCEGSGLPEGIRNSFPEAQRIRLATQIGSHLSGVLYVLDEPSIGLHQRDNSKLIATLKRLRDLGNTLIVVEHDEETMREADWIVDIGPGAGIHGWWRKVRWRISARRHAALRGSISPAEKKSRCRNTAARATAISSRSKAPRRTICGMWT